MNDVTFINKPTSKKNRKRSQRRGDIERERERERNCCAEEDGNS